VSRKKLPPVKPRSPSEADAILLGRKSAGAEVRPGGKDDKRRKTFWLSKDVAVGLGVYAVQHNQPEAKVTEEALRAFLSRGEA
jgi:hypothetical protein